MNQCSLILQLNQCSLIMSPRIKRIRKVLSPPLVKGFKPYGPELPEQAKEAIMLFYEEYEALRLCDYDGYNHHAASIIMGISRPTFTRIYASVRQKISQAFVEGRQISIEGGKVYFDSDWFECNQCSSYFNNPEKQLSISACPLCGSEDIQIYSLETNGQIEKDNCHSNKCFCPNCGYEETNESGHQQTRNLCPKCNRRMKIRKAGHCIQ